jgi:hypothetical protein
MVTILGDFCLFSAQKNGVLLKNQSYDNFFQKLAVFGTNNDNALVPFFNT